VKEKPILFSGPMVRAILDGRKTMTRRVVKPQPPHSCTYTINGANSHALCFGPIGECVPPTAKSADHRLPCPYGQPGDRLWIKESYCCKADENEQILEDEFWYRSTDEGEGIVALNEDGGIKENKDGTEASPWISSRFMPRKASRITLEVTGVRVERLKEITEEDAKAEGVDGPSENPLCVGDCRTHYSHFRELWDSINAKRGFGWDSNPLVWVIEFKMMGAA
jgi:hypothetical protein